jgi:hypothetical protein
MLRGVSPSGRSPLKFAANVANERRARLNSRALPFDLQKRVQQLKALPLPAFFFWPGGQKRGLFAPCRPATSERDEVPVVLACDGESVTCLP